MENQSSTQLKRSLGALSVWGMGVGYVISGMYFGWNLGLPQSGPYGLLAATLIIALMYVCFTLSYAELATAIPRAGGVFVYTERALGPYAGFLAGLAQNIEFVFAPPAIAAAIGAYLTLFFPSVHSLMFAILAYILFTALNIWGVRESALFGVFITILAVVELLLFAGLTLPHFSWVNFTRDPLPSGWWGVLSALPFAIWFFLAIEGVANMAEEVKNPQRDLSLGFKLAMATLFLLALLVFFSAVGVKGWHAVVYPSTALGAGPSTAHRSGDPQTVHGAGSSTAHRSGDPQTVHGAGSSTAHRSGDPQTVHGAGHSTAHRSGDPQTVHGAGPSTAHRSGDPQTVHGAGPSTAHGAGPSTAHRSGDPQTVHGAGPSTAHRSGDPQTVHGAGPSTAHRSGDPQTVHGAGPSTAHRSGDPQTVHGAGSSTAHRSGDPQTVHGAGPSTAHRSGDPQTVHGAGSSTAHRSGDPQTVHGAGSSTAHRSGDPQTVHGAGPSTAHRSGDPQTVHGAGPSTAHRSGDPQTVHGAGSSTAHQSGGFIAQGAAMSDSPLPLALGYITGATHPMYHLLVSIGLLGLIASFHGILLVAGRTTMELGRARYIHHRFALLHPTRQTPMAALLLNMVLGVLILLSGKTSEMITLAALGALSIYIFALVALFVLRKKSASLDRPYRTPLYPFTPALALVIAVIAFFAMLYFNLLLGLIYFGILLLGSIYFRYTTMRVKKTDVHGK